MPEKIQPPGDRRHASLPIDRLEKLEDMFESHLQSHIVFEAALTKNTELTQQIADSTSELVDVMKGVKGIRSLIVWLAPVAAMVLSLLAYLKGGK